jgi:CheY-like chemotaxis protein
MIQEILNFIKKNNLYDYSMLDIIMEYVKKYDLDILEIADEIKNDKTFKEIFLNDLIKHGEIYFLEDDGKMKRPKKFEEVW